jgi:serralysin
MELENEPMSAVSVLGGGRWQVGQTIRIKFISGGSNYIRTKIRESAKGWLPYVNLRFDFVESGDADIRIAINNSGASWSYLGTGAKYVAPNEATMNFGWFTESTPDEEYERVVLHEFGHALGLQHEQQHPESGIPWDKPRVYQHYAATQGWSQYKTDEQVMKRLSGNQTQYTSYDPTSIMHYAVSNELTIGDYEIPWNKRLSPTDKRFIATLYPATAAPAVCSKCKGTGAFTTTETCSVCSGTGKQGSSSSSTCSGCNGEGSVLSTCGTCSGNGTIAGNTTETTSCAVCFGIGSGTCIPCGGKGSVTDPIFGNTFTCLACSGKGTWTCFICDGKGHTTSTTSGNTTCSTCNGTGKRRKKHSNCNGTGKISAGSSSCTTCSGRGTRNVNHTCRH